MKTDLAVALDFPSVGQAEELLTNLEGLPVVYKIGLELFLVAGPTWVKNLAASGLRIFLDLKFYDIPNTVARAVSQAASMGVEFTTVHLMGGKKMFDTLEMAPKILGVSVLTSFSEGEWNENVMKVAREPLTIEQSILNGAALADSHSKIFGLVCSPKEIAPIRKLYPNLFLLVPGIRPEGSSTDDQARTMTPAEAAKAGASMIVVGRPITKASNPRLITEQILKEIKN